MRVKTIIKEGVPTVHNRIYAEGSLQKMKEVVQDKIDSKTFLVFPPMYRYWVNGSGTLKDAIGIVNSFEIEDGQGIFDITIIKDSPIAIIEKDVYADLLLEAKTGENNFVDLTDMKLHGIKLALEEELYG